jgi:hypothetical protein
MPWGDGTGPAGFGPMTGRAAGYCAGYAVPGYANPYGLRGWGRGGGRGWGRGWGHGWGRGWGHASYGYAPYAGYTPYAVGYAPYGAGYNIPYAAPWGQALTKEQETEYLKDQQGLLKQQMEEIDKRLQELTAEGKK